MTVSILKTTQNIHEPKISSQSVILMLKNSENMEVRNRKQPQKSKKSEGNEFNKTIFLNLFFTKRKTLTPELN